MRVFAVSLNCFLFAKVNDARLAANMLNIKLKLKERPKVVAFDGLARASAAGRR